MRERGVRLVVLWVAWDVGLCLGGTEVIHGKGLRHGVVPQQWADVRCTVRRVGRCEVHCAQGGPM